jgi:hypothetical protein
MNFINYFIFEKSNLEYFVYTENCNEVNLIDKEKGKHSFISS